MVRFDPLGDWRRIGDTSPEDYERAFRAIGSPMVDSAAACHAAASPHSAVALYISFHEQKHFTWDSPIPREFNNPLSLAKPEGGAWSDRWMRFPDVAACFTEWRRRVLSPTYKPSDPGVYHRTKTFADLIEVYAPPVENDTEHYVNLGLEMIAAMPARKGTTVATTPKPLNMTKGLIPLPPITNRFATQKVENVGMNRLGRRRKFKGVCWHRGLTGASSLDGAVGWLLAPTTQGLTDGYIDHRDGRAVRMIPLPGQDPKGDMVPWAQGPFYDWAASADAKAFLAAYMAESGMGVSVWNGFLESWEVTGDYYTPISDATKRAIIRINASRAHDMGVRWDQYPLTPAGISVLYSHLEGCGVAYKACAGAVVWVFINSAEHIEAVQALMRSYQEGTAAPDLPSGPLPQQPQYAKVIRPRYLGDFSKPIIKDGKTTLYLVTDQYRAVRPTGRFQRASLEAARVGEDMRSGEDASISFIFEAEDGRPWGMSNYGTRFFLDDFQRVSDVPAKA